MHRQDVRRWQHGHTFNQEHRLEGERKTLWVIGITALMMVVEIAAGMLFGSMALLADGLHMAAHTVALSINVFAYIYARRQAKNRSFSFGTGKVNALGGFTGAILLGVFALIMAWESLGRIVSPVDIAFNQAIWVAIMGLIVNGISVFILQSSDVRGRRQNHHDHNLRAAYLHVLADTVTSILAVLALLSAKYLGYIWMDPLMGIVGSVLVTRWSMGLMRAASRILLDKQGPEEIQEKIKESIEKDGDSRVAGLHLWAVGPNIYSVIITVVARSPLEPEEYKQLIPPDLGLVHTAVEVCRCREDCIRR